MRTFKYTLTIVALIGALLLSIGTSAQARPAGKGAGNDHAYSAQKIDKKTPINRVIVGPTSTAHAQGQMLTPIR